MEPGSNHNKSLKDIYEGSPDLKKYIKDRYQKMFEKMLDLVEDFILVSDPANGQKVFQNIRSKILRQGNNAIRELEDIFNQFTIKEKIIIKDKIEFGQHIKDQARDKEEKNGQGKS